MACEQAVRRGGLGQVTDSMWLVLAFQAWYVADGLYNEVTFIWVYFPNFITNLLSIARNLYNYGYHDRRSWFHAYSWPHHLVTICIFSSSALPGLQPAGARSDVYISHNIREPFGLLHLQSCQRWEGSVPEGAKSQQQVLVSSLSLLYCWIVIASRLEIYGHQKRFQTAHRRVVGLVPSSQLSVRSQLDPQKSFLLIVHSVATF